MVALKIGVQELVVGLESDKVELVSAEAQVGSERETLSGWAWPWWREFATCGVCGALFFNLRVSVVVI